ncbi:MAG: hypothetical protein HOO01_07220 [Cellvibrionales bacterium]|nr:hypothetical protein [Cellvibrionales bacterium]
MAKIIKGLLGLIGLLVVIAVIAAVVVANNLGGIIKSGINDHGVAVVGVPVSVSDVAINFLDGSASISDLHVGNPEGFSQGNAFELKRIDVELDLMSLTKPVVIINRITIDGAQVFAEQVGTTTNLQVIKDKMASGTSSDPEPASVESEASSSAPNIAIALFEFTEAKAVVKSQQFGEESVTVPNIVLQEIGTPEEGVTIESAAQSLMQPLMKKVISEIQKQVLDEQVDKALKKALGDKAGQYKEAIKGLFNR